LNALRERFERLATDASSERSAGPAGELRLRSGTAADYEALSEFHYLGRAPATATRVLVLETTGRSVAGRFLGRRETEAWPIAVLVESMPALGCRLREGALGHRYAQWPDRRERARLINAEIRCISRVVVHPQWRGLGLAVRLVREALATMRTAYTEALAAMGRVHPFFERAGMTAYRRWPLKRDQRLREALAWAGIEPWELARPTAVRRRIEAEPTGLLREELARWAGRRRSLAEQVELARDRLLCEPVYYLAARDAKDG
jgi:GNAT superfamily N-acetyltransferase